MFRGKVKTNVLKEVVEVISTLVDEAKFNINKDGIVVKAVDPAHVAMVELTLGSKAFEEYKASEIELGIDVDKLKDVLRWVEHPTDSILMEYDKSKNKFVVMVGNAKRTMPLVDTSNMTDTKVPNLNLPVKIVAKIRDITNTIKASDKVSDHIAIQASPDGLNMTARSGEDILEVTLNKETLESIDCKENTKSLFALDLFSKMIRATGSSEKITLNLGNDFPIRMEFDIAEGNGHVKYLLAPRIESE